MAFHWSTLFILALLGISLHNGPLVGDFPTYKTWWAKELFRNDLYTAGRLTESQIKYTYEAGFKSMIAMFYYETGSTIGEEILPSGEDELKLARNLVGLEFTHILSPGESWKRLETVERFGRAYRDLTKPIMFHCTSSYSASATSLMYFLNNTKNNPEEEPKVTLDEFFRQSAAMGYDYASDDGVMDMIREIMGEEDIVVPIRPNVTISNWNSKYWLTRPIHDNWYAAGQIRSNYLSMVKNFDTVINLRRGKTSEDTGEPSQEEVTLLNVKDDTGTYTGEGRQTKSELEKNRIDASRSNNYIAPDSTVNYQKENKLEFGDQVGYSEEEEKDALVKDGIDYYHIPIDEEKTSLEHWRAHKSLFLQIGEAKNAILLHSRNAENAVMFGLLSAGCQHRFDSDWALDKSGRMGFNWQKTTHPQVIQALETVLNNQATEC